MGGTKPKGGVAAFERLVWQVMIKEPYASARRVFWIVDNGLITTESQPDGHLEDRFGTEVRTSEHN